MVRLQNYKNMKNMKYFICLLIGLLSFSSCSDFLDREPDDMLTLEKVFDNKQNTLEWLAGIYSCVPNTYSHFMQEGPLGDDLAPHAEWTGWFANDIVGKQNGNWNPNSDYYKNYWNTLPQKIRQARIFLQNVKPIPSQSLAADEVERMKLEARFLIAYYYSILVEFYGAVPFTTELIDADASQEVLMMKQVPAQEVIQWVSQELLDVSKQLPANYTNNALYGRATSLMCLAVRSRILLMAASPLLNGNKDYINHKNPDGEELLYAEYDENRWKEAARAAKECIDAAHAAGKKLYTVYNPDGTVDPLLSCQGIQFKKETEGNTELLFIRPDAGDFGAIDRWSIPRSAPGAGAVGVTQSLVDAFFMENGLPPILGYENNDYSKPIINAASGYSEKGFSDIPEVRNTQWIECQGDEHPGQVTLAGTYNMYCHREARFYTAVLYNRAWFRKKGENGAVTEFMKDEPDGGISLDAPRNGYLQNKLAHPERDQDPWTFPYRPSVNYRLAEVYLNYAEALNECEPGNPDILEYVNKIRHRAGIPEYGAGAGMILAPQGQDNVREAIHRERRVELCCESSIRYMDIRRLKLGEQILNRDFYGMNYFGTKLSDDENDPDAYFVRTKYQTRSFMKKNYFFPIPQAQIDINPNLVQNPFWDKK